MLDTKFNILIVEDNQRYLKLIGQEIMDTTGATVEFATTGPEALQILETPGKIIDLLLLDLNIPEISGHEVLHIIRADNKFDNMPVIILTGDTGPDIQSKLFSIGADDFIEKGCAAEIFIERLKAQIRHKLAIDRMTNMALDMDVFIAGVLHDIRNIETNMLALCDIIKMQLEDKNLEDRRQALLKDVTSLKQQINRIGEYASDVIEQVRDTKKELHPNSINIEGIFSWAQEIVNSGKSKDDSTYLDIEIRQPLKLLYADKHFLRLAILNIFQNARKYSRKDIQPKIIVTQRPGAEGREQRIITRFRDNGQGLKKNELRKIFAPFVKATSKASESEQSSGLGLALVAKVLNKMGGRVWAELPDDNLGPGTVFCIELPAGIKN